MPDGGADTAPVATRFLARVPDTMTLVPLTQTTARI